MKYYPIGESALQLPIFAHEWGPTDKPAVLIIGGVHGDEIEGVALARSLIQSVLLEFKEALNLIIIPELNPDGVLLKTRGNGHGIDLNRNLPTKDWVSAFTNPRYNPGPAAASEPENKALIEWLSRRKPRLILSLHSWTPLLNVNGDSLPEAQKIAQTTHYKIETDIGYPTPGCLGTYAGLERGIGTLTYEIERGLSLERVVREHTFPIREALKVSAQRFA